METIERKQYLDKLIAFKDKRLIKVVTGVRRCGKSTLLALFEKYLKAQGVADDRIIFINFEDFDNYRLNDPFILHEYIKDRLINGQMTYVFLDEVQNVRNFQRVLDSLYIKDNVDLYVTGSNAYLLSGELATLLSGRYVEISMLPFSFKEYITAVGNTDNLGAKYSDYIARGAFPYTMDLRTQPKENQDYLQSIYNTIVVKDVARRKGIGDTMLLESVTRFVFDNIGNTLSTKKIADTLTSNGRSANVKTVEKYIDALRESFVIYQAKRYDIKGRQYLKTLDKYYVVDMGLRYALLGNKSADVGHILENVVYLELLRRGYDVYVGKVNDAEVDFVAINTQGIEYYQVSATVRGENTLARELSPLRKIADNYPKYVLTLDEDPDGDYDGIRSINALKWLLSL